MIDWCKILIPERYWDHLFNLDIYDSVRDHFSRKDLGEKQWCIKTFMQLKIKFFASRRIELSGSLHTFKNCSKNNSDDFYLSEFRIVLSNLEKTFGIDLNECTLLNFEFGVNIIPPVETMCILDGCCLFRRKRFNRDFSCRFLEVELQRFYGKIYDKKYWCDRNQILLQEASLLRVEIKTRKRIHKVDFGGVESPWDLTREKVLVELGSSLMRFVRGLIYIDPFIDIERLKQENNRSKIDQMLVFNNWYNLVDSDQDKNTAHQKLKRWHKQVRIYSEIYGDNIQDRLVEAVANKWKDLVKR